MWVCISVCVFMISRHRAIAAAIQVQRRRRERDAGDRQCLTISVHTACDAVYSHTQAAHAVRCACEGESERKRIKRDKEDDERPFDSTTTSSSLLIKRSLAHCFSLRSPVLLYKRHLPACIRRIRNERDEQEREGRCTHTQEDRERERDSSSNGDGKGKQSSK